MPTRHLQLDQREKVFWNPSTIIDGPVLSERVYAANGMRMTCELLGFYFRFTSAFTSLDIQSIRVAIEVQMPAPIHTSHAREAATPNVWLSIHGGLGESQAILFVRRFATLLKAKVAALRQSEQSDPSTTFTWPLAREFLFNPNYDQVPVLDVDEYDLHIERMVSSMCVVDNQQWPHTSLRNLVDCVAGSLKRSSIRDGMNALGIPETVQKSVLNSNTCNGRRKNSKGKYLLASAWRQIECQNTLANAYLQQQEALGKEFLPATSLSHMQQQQGDQQHLAQQSINQFHTSVVLPQEDNLNNSSPSIPPSRDQASFVGRCCHCNEAVRSNAVKATWHPLNGCASYNMHLHLVMSPDSPDDGHVVAVKGIKYVPVLLEPKKKLCGGKIIDNYDRFCDECVKQNSKLHASMKYTKQAAIQTSQVTVENRNGFDPSFAQDNTESSNEEFMNNEFGSCHPVRNEFHKFVEFLKKEQQRRRVRKQTSCSQTSSNIQKISAELANAQIMVLTQEMAKAMRHLVGTAISGGTAIEFTQLLGYCDPNSLNESVQSIQSTLVPNVCMYLTSRYLQTVHLTTWRSSLAAACSPNNVSNGGKRNKPNQVTVSQVVNHLATTSSPLWVFLVSLTLARRKNVELSRFYEDQKVSLESKSDTQCQHNRYLSTRAQLRIEALDKFCVLQNEKARMIHVGDEADATNTAELDIFQQRGTSADVVRGSGGEQQQQQCGELSYYPTQIDDDAENDSNEHGRSIPGPDDLDQNVTHPPQRSIDQDGHDDNQVEKHSGRQSQRTKSAAISSSKANGTTFELNSDVLQSVESESQLQDISKLLKQQPSNLAQPHPGSNRLLAQSGQTDASSARPSAQTRQTDASSARLLSQTSSSRHVPRELSSTSANESWSTFERHDVDDMQTHSKRQRI